MKKYNYMKTINNNGDLSPPDNFRDHSHMFPSHWQFIILTLNFRISSFFYTASVFKNQNIYQWNMDIEFNESRAIVIQKYRELSTPYVIPSIEDILQSHCY